MDKKDLLGISGTGKKKINLKDLALAGIGNLGLESIKEDKPKMMIFGSDDTGIELAMTIADKMNSEILVVSGSSDNYRVSERNFLEDAFLSRPYTKDLTEQLDKINLELANIPYTNSEIGTIIPRKTKMIGVLSPRPYSNLSISDMELDKCYSEILEQDESMYSDLDNTRDYMKKFSPRKTFDKRNMIKRR